MRSAFLSVAVCAAIRGLAATQSTATPPAAPDGQSSKPADQNQSQSTSSSSSRTHHKPNPAGTGRARIADEGASSDLTRAEDLIQKHDYVNAAPLLHKVVESDPSNYVAWFDLGFAENGMGNVTESIAAYRKSVTAKPDVFESNLNLGLQLAKTQQSEAAQFLRAATRLKPTSQPAEGQERAWLSLAHVLETSNPDDAIAAYREAATLQSKDPEPHLAAGLLLEKQEKFADAVEEYKQALALDNSSEALTGIANVYMRGRKFPEAEEYLRKLVAARPNDAGAHIQLGRVLAAEGKNDDAVVELDAGAKLAPTDATARMDLADLFTTLGKNDQAEIAYRSLVAQSPNDAGLHRSLGQSLLRQKKFADAQQEFLAAVNLKHDFGDAYGDLAFAASENKDYPLSLKALAARSQFLPDTALTYFLRGSDFDHLKDYKQAAVNFHLFLNVANGKYPDQEWQAKHRLIAIEPKR